MRVFQASPTFYPYYSVIKDLTSDFQRSLIDRCSDNKRHTNSGSWTLGFLRVWISIYCFAEVAYCQWHGQSRKFDRRGSHDQWHWLSGTLLVRDVGDWRQVTKVIVKETPVRKIVWLVILETHGSAQIYQLLEKHWSVTLLIMFLDELGHWWLVGSLVFIGKSKQAINIVFCSFASKQKDDVSQILSCLQVVKKVWD